MPRRVVGDGSAETGISDEEAGHLVVAQVINWRSGQDHVRAGSSQSLDNPTTGLVVVEDRQVSELEANVLRGDDPRGGFRLSPTDRGDLVRLVFGAAAIPRGHSGDRHVMPGLTQEGEGSRALELDIIGVGMQRQNSNRFGHLGLPVSSIGPGVATGHSTRFNASGLARQAPRVESIGCSQRWQFGVIAAAICAAALVVLPSCGPSSAPPSGTVEFSARTEGSPSVLASHLDSLRSRYEGTTATDPRVANANFESYAEAVISTAESLWAAAEANYPQRKKAAEMILEIWHDRLARDPEFLDELLAWSDRIKTEAPPDSDLIATAAYYRFLGLDAKGTLDQASAETKTEALVEAALELGRARPPRPEAKEILNRVGDQARSQGLNNAALSVFRLLAETYPDDPLGRRGAGLSRRLGGVGTVVDDLQGPTLAGGQLDVEELRGRVVLVVFWGTAWQPIEELGLDSIRSYREEFGPEDFAVLGVLFDTDFRRAEQFLAQHKIDWTQILAPANVEMRTLGPPPIALKFGIENSPDFMLLDREGRLIAIEATFDLVEASLKELLEQGRENHVEPEVPATPLQDSEGDAADVPEPPAQQDDRR